ncbi:hypothetical protein KC323_g15 [Hortaea werneckii]|nr:hypothetical protein KC323_g15 [Hortaea werneckii]
MTHTQTGLKPSWNVKMRASENPDRSDSDKTMGSLTNISKGRIQVIMTSWPLMRGFFTSRAALRHEEVDGLNNSTEDKLDPEVPSEALSQHSTKLAADDRFLPLKWKRLSSAQQRQYPIVVLPVGKDIDQEQRELEDRPTSELLTPGGPKLAAKGVGNEENHLPDAGCLFANAVLLCDKRNSIGEDTGVEDGQQYPRWGQASSSVMTRLPSPVYFWGTDDLRRSSLELPTPSSTPFSRSRARSLLEGRPILFLLRTHGARGMAQRRMRGYITDQHPTRVSMHTEQSRW